MTGQRFRRSRRQFLKLTALGAAGTAMASTLSSDRAISKSPPTGSTLRASTGDRLRRMLADVRRALRKPDSERRWIMVIDPRRCVGCRACVVACKAENVTPPGVSYREVPEVELGLYPQVNRIFMPTNCMQCDNPPCQKAAPEGAIVKRPDGIVAIDYTKFTSREAFEAARRACPYAALYWDDGTFATTGTPSSPQPYETRTFYEYDGVYARTGGAPPVGSARKCHFCVHRLEAGLLPACVSTCIGGAMAFGDHNDPESLVSELLATHRVIRVNERAGTQPRVYYIEDELPNVRRLISCTVCHR